MKKQFLLAAAFILSVLPQFLSANSCDSSFSLGVINNQQFFDVSTASSETEVWFSVTPTSGFLSISVTDLNDQAAPVEPVGPSGPSGPVLPIDSPLTHFHIMEIFSGTCGNLTLHASIDLDAENALSGREGLLALLVQNLVPGNQYFIRLMKMSSQTCSQCANSATNFRITLTPLLGGCSDPNNSCDCSDAIEVCSNAGVNFSVNTGSGMVGDIPQPCNIGNPGPPLNVNPPPCPEPNTTWGSPNNGCLKMGERHSTWFHFTVTASGNLSFNLQFAPFQPNGSNVQTGELDWILYPYSPSSGCAPIGQNAVAPVRCNWNGPITPTGLFPMPPNTGSSNVNFEPTLPVLCGQEYVLCISNWLPMSDDTRFDLSFTSSTAGISCPTSPVISTTQTETSCPGDPVTLTAFAQGATVYSWVPGNQTGSTITVNPTSATTYTVYVFPTSACGSGTSSAFVTVNVLAAPSFNPAFSYNSSGNPIFYSPAQAYICQGDPVYLYSNIFGPGLTYNWQPGNFSAPFISVSPSVTTTYTITVTNSDGCSTTANIVVNVNPPPSIFATGTPPSCNGGNNGTATINFSLTPVYPPYTYAWSNGQTTQTITGLSVGCYTVVVTDGNGCSSSTTVCLPQPPVLTASASATPGLICNPGTSQLNCVPNGGTGPYTFNWQPNGDLNNPTAQNPAASPSATTVYTVTVTDANGCTTTATALVDVFGTGLTITSDNEKCVGEGYHFSCNILNATSYSWDFGDGSVSNQVSPTYQYQQPGIFTVTLIITGGPGCTAIATVVINVTPGIPGGYNDVFGNYCCTGNFTYDFNNYVINSNATYQAFIAAFTPNVPLNIKDTLWIKHPGVNIVLTNKTIQFGPWGRVIIEQGSLVTLDNTTLTGLLPCETMWQGVEVWGTPTRDHSTANFPYHGRFYMLNGSKVEHAHIAVTLGWNCYNPPLIPCPNQPCLTYGCRDFGGGIIDADQNSQFNSCGMELKFLPFRFFNRSRIRNCHFNDLGISQGAVFDPGYNTSFTGWQYPNAFNPYYSPANASQRTGKQVYMYGVKQVLFDDNIFFDCENGFELINAQVRLMDVNNNLIGSQFKKMTTGFTASYFNSTIFGNLITGNRFDDISGQHSIRIDGGKYDQIYNNRLGFNATIFSNFGMILNNASAFVINDNRINKNPIGVWAINSGANGGLIGYTALGNIFTLCQRALVTTLNNSNLQIRCDQFINNANPNYTANWSTTSQLADQGNFPFSSDMDAAGDKFDPFMFSGFNREIVSSFSAFQYLRNNSSVLGDPTCIIPDLTLAPNVIPSNTGINETPTSCDPCPAPCNNLIGDLNNRIIQLKTECANKLASLDGSGNTQALIDAVNGPMSNGQLKNLLLANTPLSDAVIIALINRNNNLPYGLFLDVMLPNSPVSRDVRPVLYAYLATVPSGISDQIKNAQLNFSNRTLAVISTELNSATNQQLLLVNDAVAYYMASDTLPEDSLQFDAMQILQQQNSTASNQTLASTYIYNEDFANATSSLNALNPVNAEEQNFKDLQQMLNTLGSQGLTVFNMSPAQMQFVEQLALQSPGSLASVNACAILKLMYGTDCSLPDPFQNNLRVISPPSSNGTWLGNNQYLGRNYPNPFSSSTFIPYYLPTNSGGYIKVYDINGILMQQILIAEGSNIAEVETGDWKAGVYMYAIEIDGVQVEFDKMILIK